MIRSSNPALSDKVFDAIPYYGENSMTINGTVNKTALLLFLAVSTASWSWYTFTVKPEAAGGLIMIGGIGGLIAALVTIFKKTAAPISAPIYALLEGLLLGGISAMYEAQFTGIVFQAIVLTFGTLGCLLIAYRSGLIRATENFKLGICAATGAIFMIYMVTMILGFFGVNMPYIHGNGLVGIGFSLVVVVIAALNLVMDFDFIERGVKNGAPKYMEWYGAFGLMVTLVWLYLEMLRLLSKIQSRR